MSRKKIHVPIKNGRANIAGMNIKKIRLAKNPELSQNGLATLIQLEGIPMTKNTVQRMEAGQGTINDIQLVAFAKVLKVDVKALLDESVYKSDCHSEEVHYPPYSENENTISAATQEPEYK